MSCYTGSNIVNDGMILNLDASNRKSWSGTGNERIGSIVPTWDVWGGLTGSAVAYNNSGGQGVFINTITSGGVNWWYSTGGQLPCISSKQYMISAKVRYSGELRVRIYFMFANIILVTVKHRKVVNSVVRI